MPLAREATVRRARVLASSNSACRPGWMRMSAISRIMVFVRLRRSDPAEIFAPLEVVLVGRFVETPLLALLDAREVADEIVAEGGAEAGVGPQRLECIPQAGGQLFGVAAIRCVGRGRRAQPALDAIESRVHLGGEVQVGVGGRLADAVL